jgi:hypothetical protein
MLISAPTTESGVTGVAERVSVAYMIMTDDAGRREVLKDVRQVDFFSLLCSDAGIKCIDAAIFQLANTSIQMTCTEM